MNILKHDLRHIPCSVMTTVQLIRTVTSHRLAPFVCVCGAENGELPEVESRVARFFMSFNSCHKLAKW